MSKAVEAGDVARVTTFFSDRDVAPTVHVSDQIPAIRNQFLRQGYRETGENRILAFRLRRDVPPDAPQDNDVHRLQPNEKWDWVQAVAQGFLEKVETTADDVIVGETVYRAATDHFLVRSNSGEIAGTAGFAQRSGVGVFFADSTRPQYRSTGIQGRLIRTRLLHAKRAGCDLVAATVAPGGASEKNYLRCGFQILYSRITLEHW
jgi:GNAT superfamily N-acetyltransferase